MRIKGLKMPGGSEYEFYGAVYTGTSEDNAATAAKTASISDFDSSSLVNGVEVAIYFTNENTAENPTLNISNTGAKTIYSHGNEIWNAGDIVKFIYDSTNNRWTMIGNSSYITRVDCATAEEITEMCNMLGMVATVINNNEYEIREESSEEVSE